MSRIELARKAVPAVRVHAIHEGGGEDGAGGSGHILVNYDREASVVMTGLSLGPRGSGAVKAVAASGDPSFADPTLTVKRRTPCDERVSSCQSGAEAGSGVDGRVKNRFVLTGTAGSRSRRDAPRLAMSGVSAIVGR